MFKVTSSSFQLISQRIGANNYKTERTFGKFINTVLFLLDNENYIIYKK